MTQDKLSPKYSGRFIVEFIENLKKSNSVNNRESAWLLMREIMNKVEDQYNLDKHDYVKRMHVFSLLDTVGWCDLDKDPCFWIDSYQKKHKVTIYNSGRIVIINMMNQNIILDKR